MIKTDLNRLKRKTKWSWEKMCREMHRVMGEEGPSHTTLWRMATGKVKHPQPLVERYVLTGIERLREE